LVVAACVSPAGAHEIATTRADATFRSDRTYEVKVVTDAASLVEKLEAVHGKRAPVSNDAAELRRRLRDLFDGFRTRAAVDFDGIPVVSTFDYEVSAGTALDPPAVTVTLRGTVPASAATFAWTYGWTLASYSLSVHRPDAAEPSIEWLEKGQRSSPVPLARVVPLTRARTASRYVGLGFTHIVPHGWDHVLFVLGIFLLGRRVRDVLAQITAFTVAHSLTLALSMFGVWSLPARVVEPLIALSIAYVAVENILGSGGSRLAEAHPECYRERRRTAPIYVIFAFGLLHGMGFAGVLAELGLPRSEFITALVTFNLGVELGQLAVVITAFVLVAWPFARRAWYRSLVVLPASALIACLGLYWTVGRLAS
jgi:hypothetical protein